MCLDAATGKLLWQWQGPAKKVPSKIDGFHRDQRHSAQLASARRPRRRRSRLLRHAPLQGDVPGRQRPAAGPEAGKARVVWTYDMWDKLGVFPCDAANGSPLIDGDLLYVPTSNGVDRNTDPSRRRTASSRPRMRRT